VDVGEGEHGAALLGADVDRAAGLDGVEVHVAASVPRAVDGLVIRPLEAVPHSNVPALR
jgi:hypothetical protein